MKRIALSLTLVFLVAAGLASTARSDQPEGPVEFWVTTDFSVFPFTSVLTVVQGEDILGCSWGTAVDSWPADPHASFQSCIVRSDIYCGRNPDENGPDLTIVLNPNSTIPGPGDLNGQWVFWKGTGEFENLRGQGRVSVIFDWPNNQLHAIYSGMAHRDP